MKTMRLNIGMCGTHSITGCIADKVTMVGASPDKIIVDIDTVMLATDVNKELAKAQLAFAKRPFTVELGLVTRDLYQEDLACHPDTAVCFS
jgi:hydroxymethylpyrimidine/phosphomethylpyrimidine kinase